MTSYQIIDEPKLKSYQHLIVDPILILFISFIVPIFWAPPLYGKFWIPVCWILTNGFLLGSPTYKQELIIAIIGSSLFIGILFGFIHMASINALMIDTKVAAPYVGIIINSFFFLTMYIIVFKQAAPYSIFQYIKENK